MSNLNFDVFLHYYRRNFESYLSRMLKRDWQKNKFKVLLTY